MSVNPKFWTKEGVKRHTLQSGASEFSTSSSTQYTVGSWVWYKGDSTATPAIPAGLYVCKVATTGGVWESGKWASMNDVSSLFTSENSSLVEVCKAEGGTKIKQDEQGNFYYEVEEE